MGERRIVLGGHELTVSLKSIRDLYAMLSTCRPAGSDTEEQFLDRYLKPLQMSRDQFGNMWKRIGEAPIAWSCHTDTVHRTSGAQNITVDVNKWEIKLQQGSKSGCLGADDTLGVWLMIEMIKAKRPGLYLFHRCEETGGKGSKWLAANASGLFKDTKAVIALDRRGLDSVITRQWGGRCCSDVFAESLAGKLDLSYRKDQGGSFTDSANYIDLVGECTNLSVGYWSQHSSNEWVDLRHLLKLREALVTADFSALTFKRKPGEKEKFVTSYYGSGHWRGGKWHSDNDRKYNGTNGNKGYTAWKPTPLGTLSTLVRSYPTTVSQILLDWGFDPEMMEAIINEYLAQVGKEGSPYGSEHRSHHSIM